jgi:hypothetical protein
MLGITDLVEGQHQMALTRFVQELASARAVSDPFAEKMALDHLARGHATLGNGGAAFASIEQALAVARKVGDHQHEADLLWSLGILYADRGQRDLAITQAQAAIDVLRRWRKPQAAWFADHLEKYRVNAATTPLAGGSVKTGGSVTTIGWGLPAAPPEGQEPGSGPGLLRMAMTAIKSMGKFVGSGMKTVSAEAQQSRIQVCASCPHHTGVRCRLCGCFTRVKAWLPHEDCPIGKWPGTTAEAPARGH